MFPYRRTANPLSHYHNFCSNSRIRDDACFLMNTTTKLFVRIELTEKLLSKVALFGITREREDFTFRKQKCEAKFESGVK